MRNWKHMQVNKDNTHKTSKIVDHDLKVRDKFMLNNNNAFKYYTPYKGLFEIMCCWTNDKFIFQFGATKLKYSICCIKPYKTDKNVEDIKS